MRHIAADTVSEGKREIKHEDWNVDTIQVEFQATNAEPGSREKLDILAQRIRLGLPLWHPEDRHVEDVGPPQNT